MGAKFTQYKGFPYGIKYFQRIAGVLTLVLLCSAFLSAQNTAQQDIQIIWPLTTDGEAVYTSGIGDASFSAGTGLQNFRFDSVNGATAGGWNSRDLNKSAYYEYRISPERDATIVINELNFEVSLSLVNMRTAVHYSKDGFNMESVPVAASVFVGRNSARNLHVKTNIVVSYPETLSVRIYGWSAPTPAVTFFTRNAEFKGTTLGPLEVLQPRGVEGDTLNVEEFRGIISETPEGETPEGITRGPLEIPVVFNVTGGGSYCQGGTGVDIFLSGSEADVNYVLYLNGNPTATNQQGTGAPLTFPNITAAGTYTIGATHTDNSFEWMAGDATVTILPNVTPAVSITASPGNNICAGTSVTFTATPVNGGATPGYQWYIGANPVSGETNQTFTTTTLTNGNQVRVVMTSNAPCAVPATATSNIITMTVNPVLTPTVTINASATTICAGSPVTFTAAPVINGGTAPQFQWRVNGVNVVNPLGNSASYSTTTLANGDVVTVELTSNAVCAIPATVISNPVTITVNPIVVPEVTIVASENDICPGTLVTFTATPVNGGSSPAYQWRLNGVNVGTNNAVYSSATLVNGDQITVVLTSNANCASPTTATSNVITMTVRPGTPATPGAIAGTATVCPAATEIYTIAAVPGADTYNWTVPAGWVIESGFGTISITVTTGATGQNGNISVTAENFCGTSAASTLAVVVGSESTAPTGINITNNETCQGTAKTLSVAGGSLGTGAVWEWFTGSCGGTPAGTGASITVDPPAGSTTIYYVRASGLCNTTDCAEGTVIVSPAAPAQPGPITGISPVCPGTTGHVYSISAVPDAETYTWTVPSGWTIAGGQGTLSITVDAGITAISGNITVTATNSCGTSAPAVYSVTVSPGVPATPGPITGPVEVCINQTGIIYSISAVPNATSYTWTVPSGWNITSGNGTTSITVSTTGAAVNGEITVVAVNSCGTSAPSSYDVKVSTAIPATPAQPTGPQSICPVAEGMIYSVPVVQGTTTYNWTFPAGWTITAGAGTNQVTVTAGATSPIGNFNVTVSATNACGTSALSQPLGVTIGRFATAWAGDDRTICFDTPWIEVNGVAGGAANPNKGSWTTSGTGTFNNANRPSTIYTPSNADRIAGTVTLTFTTDDPNGSCGPASDSFILTIRPLAVASISSPETTICEGSEAIITFTATPNTVVTYNVNGGASQTINIPASGTVNLNTGILTANTTYNLVNVFYPTDPACSRLATGSVTIIVQPAATVNAGPDQVICEGNSATLAGTVGGGASSGTWSGGTGTFDPDANTLNAIYTPSAAEVAAGTVTLTLTTNDPDGPCKAAFDSMVITIQESAIADAGNDQDICEGSLVQLQGSVGGSATGGTWTTGGDGTFSPNATTLNATYTPGNNDIILGEVTLTLTTNDPGGICTPATDQMIIKIYPAATVDAGPDQVICEGDHIILAGTIGGSASRATWSGGAGTFVPDEFTLNAEYVPTPAEIAAGTVTLTLTADDPDGDGPCERVFDEVVITIEEQPTVDAGVDQTICAGSAVALAGSIGGSAVSALWSGGNGTFAPDANTLNALYTPSADEIAAGTVTLTLTTNDPDGPCVAASDNMTITINPGVEISAGADQEICSGGIGGGTATMAGSYGGGATGATWTTSGSGTFDDPASPSAIYTPSNADILAGTVILTYTTNDPEGPCGPGTDQMTLTIHEEVLITTQPANVGICVSYPVDFSVVAIGDGLTYQWYSGTAPGTPVTNTGNISGAQSPTLHFNMATLADAGTYYVIISGISPCEPVVSNEVTLVVDETIDITDQPVSQTVCIGEDVTFSVTATVNRADFTYRWYKDGVALTDGGNISGATTPDLTIASVTLADAGDYNVLIEGDASYACPSVWSDIATLTVQENSTIALTSAVGTDDQDVCTGEAITNITYAIGGSGTGATVTGLPDGVTGSYNNGVFTISGTPTENINSPYLYTVTTEGPCANVTATGTITVNPGNTIALTSPAGSDAQTVCNGTAIANITYETTGATGADFSGLPAGVTGTWTAGTPPDMTGLIIISGTPTVPGNYSYTITLTGGCGVVTASGTIDVTPDNTITLTSQPDPEPVCINQPMEPITYTTTGATGATFSGLPAGVSGTWTAGTEPETGLIVISGTPSESGIFTFTITLTGGCGVVTEEGTIRVLPENTISLTSATGTDNQTVCINTAIINITYSTEGATGATFDGLPAGVTGNWAGNVVTISGTPIAFGLFNYTITLTGGCGTVSASGTINVEAASAGGAIIPAETIVCTGANSGTLTLMNYTGNIIQWEYSLDGGTTWIPFANTLPEFTFNNLEATTLYRVLIQNGSCAQAYSQFAAVSVIPHILPTTTATPAEICLGFSSTLSAEAIPVPFGFINGGGFGNSGNNGWATDGDVGSLPSAPSNGVEQRWGRAVKRQYYGTAPNGAFYNSTDVPYAVVNGELNSTLETPVFNLIGVTAPSLTLLQGMHLQAGAVARIEISVDGGANYITLAEYLGPGDYGNTDGLTPYSFDLSQYIGLANLKVRFSFEGTHNSGWAIDEVMIDQGEPITSAIIYQWTPTTYLTPADGIGQTVTATPTEAGVFVYTVTATFTATTQYGVINCVLGSADVTVTVHDLPVCAITGPVDPVCPLTENVYSGPDGMVGYEWTITGNGTISGAANLQQVTVLAGNACDQPYTLTLTITDINGCFSTCSVDSFVDDDIPPTASNPLPVAVQCITDVPVADPLVVTDESDNCGTTTVTWVEDISNGQTCPETITRTYRVADLCGNEILVYQTITVDDNTAPEMTCPPSLTGICDIIEIPPYADYAAFITAGGTATDNCGIDEASFTFVGDLDDGETCPKTITRTYSVADLCGNVITCEQIIIIDDEVAPVIVCPFPPLPTPSVAVNVNDGNQYTHADDSWNATATDNCAGIITLSAMLTGATISGPHTTLNGVTFNQGITTITWVAEDECDNVDDCSFEIAVEGNMDIQVLKEGPATIIAGQDITYTITVFNDGPAIAPQVTLTDVLPAEIFAPTIWTLNGTPQTGDWPGSYVFTDLGVGVTAQQIITITGQVACDATTFTNTATVTLIAPFTDPDLTNNTSSVTTTTIDPLTVTATTVNSECPGEGSIDITVTGGTPSGGTPGYTYLWTTTDGTIPTGTETNEDLTGLTTGTYHVVVTDANGCTVEGEWTVASEDVEPPEFTLPEAPSFCVDNIISAFLDGQPEPQADIVPNPVFAPPYPSNWRRPDWYVLDGTTELDLINVADNCCLDTDAITWIIQFAGNEPGQDDLTGTGQPSDYGPIILWGTPTNISVIHTITYTVTDCAGNVFGPHTIDITIKPRPEMIKQP